MDQDTQEKHPDDPHTPHERKAGYLIMRLKPGEGVMIAGTIEVRLASVSNRFELQAQIAIRAPKEVPIRKLR